MDTQILLVALFLMGLIAALCNAALLHQVLSEIRTELRVHNSREVRRDLHTLSQEQESERR